MPTKDRPQTATTLLEKLRAGDRKAWDNLVRLLEGELHAIALRAMRAERRGHTLQPTALVHEVWLKLSKTGEVPWKTKSHFLAAAAIAMRHILVDHAKRRAPRKKAEDAVADEARRRFLKGTAIDFQEHVLPVDQLHAALGRLEKRDGRACEIVTVRYFGGLKNEEIAELLGISVKTVERDLRFARAFLFREISRMERPSG